MYALVRSLPLRRLLAEQVPVLGFAFVVAEIFYKFRSFTLECLAFLATWFVADLVVQQIRRRLGPASLQPDA